MNKTLKKLTIYLIITTLIIPITTFCYFTQKINRLQSTYDNNIATLEARMGENSQKLNKYIEESNNTIKILEKELVENQNTIKSLSSIQASSVALNETEVEAKIEENNNILTSVDKWSVNEEVPLPDLPTNMKFCVDYRWYGIEDTPHNRMQNLSYTDDKGCRRYNNDYCVALGSFYSKRIGDRFEVTLDNGNVFTVITGDMKADCDTDITNMYAPCINYDNENCANVLEFIVDDKAVSNDMYAYGSLDYHEEFKGNIVKMVYLGRDSSMDWDIYE